MDVYQKETIGGPATLVVEFSKRSFCRCGGCCGGHTDSDSGGPEGSHRMPTQARERYCEGAARAYEGKAIAYQREGLGTGKRVFAEKERLARAYAAKMSRRAAKKEEERIASGVVSA
jgi:hypothetical protein